MGLFGKSKIGLGLLVFLFAWACAEEKREAIPSHILSMQRMESFLFDLHKTESQLLLSGIRQDTAAVLFETMEKRLYQKHKLDSGRVLSSLRYYASHMEMMDSMYKHLEMRAKKVATQTNPDSK